MSRLGCVCHCQVQALMSARYRNQAAVQAHVQSPYFREFAAKVPGLVAKPMEVKMGAQLGASARVSRI
jgi:quinol monooxygenase YgiN